jgi:hypothetical protein
MAHKNQDHNALAVFTPKVSPQLSKITQSMIRNSWEYSEAYNAGPTYSKELKSLFWYIQIMQIYSTTESHKKLDHMWQDISLKLPSIISNSNINLEQQIKQMPSLTDWTMR